MRPVLNFDLRRALRRGVAACVALALFAASGGAALIGQVCMHHGGADVAPVEQVAPVSAHDGHGPGHDGAHGAAEQPTDDHAGGECTCLGACQAAAEVAAPADADVVRVPAPAAVLCAVAAVDVAPRASQAAWILPPSNGPPVLT